MATLKAEWALFNALVIPEEAPEVQRVEMRRAFYAGAQTTIGLLINIALDTNDEDSVLKAINGLTDELDKFVEEIEKGCA